MRPAEPKPQSVRTRVFRTLLLAAVGAFLGFEYARRTLDPELLEKSHLDGLYATAGAAVMVLGFRVYSVGRFVVREILRDRRAITPDDEPPAPKDPPGGPSPS